MEPCLIKCLRVLSLPTFVGEGSQQADPHSKSFWIVSLKKACIDLVGVRTVFQGGNSHDKVSAGLLEGKMNDTLSLDFLQMS